MSRTVLIGPRGFIGSSILRHFSAGSIIPLERAAADLSKPQTLRAALRPGDVVINAAGYADVTDRSPSGISRLRSANVDGVRHLVNAAIASEASQLIHISSVAAMGRVTKAKVDESDRGPLTSHYAESKWAAEQIVSDASRSLATTILRPTSVFGEGRGLARTLCRVSTLRIVPLPGGGQGRIPFTYAGNVAHAVRLTINNEMCYGRTFIVGDPESYPLDRIVVTLGEMLGRRPRIFPVHPSLAEAGVSLMALLRRFGRNPPLDRSRLATLTHSVDYSIDAFRQATAYEAPYDLRAALRRIAEWYRDGGAVE